MVEWPVIVALEGKREASALAVMKVDDRVDCVVLFSAHGSGRRTDPAVRDFAMTGKGVLVWTQPGSQGWPVGGSVSARRIDGSMASQFSLRRCQRPAEIAKIASFARASHMKRWLNMSTIGAFGGRGIGQTCVSPIPRGCACSIATSTRATPRI